MFFAWALVILGTVFLLENLNLIPVLNWDIIWPIILIVVGLYLMKRNAGDECCRWWGGKKNQEKK